MSPKLLKKKKRDWYLTFLGVSALVYRRAAAQRGTIVGTDIDREARKIDIYGNHHAVSRGGASMYQALNTQLHSGWPQQVIIV